MGRTQQPICRQPLLRCTGVLYVQNVARCHGTPTAQRCVTHTGQQTQLQFIRLPQRYSNNQSTALSVDILRLTAYLESTCRRSECPWVKCSDTEQIFTKLALRGQFVVKKSCNEFHENPTGGCVAETRSQPDGLRTQCLRCTDVDSTCHCPAPPDSADRAQRPCSAAHGQLLQIMGSNQLHSSLYLKTTKLTELRPTAKWAVGRSAGRSAGK
jgi:hypothetical protein